MDLDYASQIDGQKSADELAFKRNKKFFNFQLIEQKWKFWQY